MGRFATMRIGRLFDPPSPPIITLSSAPTIYIFTESLIEISSAVIPAAYDKVNLSAVFSFQFSAASDI
jgi:hypothetical protein